MTEVVKICLIEVMIAVIFVSIWNDAAGMQGQAIGDIARPHGYVEDQSIDITVRVFDTENKSVPLNWTSHKSSEQNISLPAFPAVVLVGDLNVVNLTGGLAFIDEANETFPENETDFDTTEQESISTSLTTTLSTLLPNKLNVQETKNDIQKLNKNEAMQSCFSHIWLLCICLWV